MRRLLSIPNYVMKMRAYPNREQAQKIDTILDGLRIAYNVTLYEMANGNPDVTSTSIDKEDPTKTVIWPDFRKAAKKEWLDKLREEHPVVKNVPATSLASNNGILLKDGKKSWETSGKLPVGRWGKDFPTYYSKKRQRNSFLVQATCSAFKTTGNKKSVKIQVNGVGLLKCRGFNNNILFDDGRSFWDWRSDNLKKALTVQVSKDNCGDYWVCISLQNVSKACSDIPEENKTPIGIDVGVHDLAITSTGKKYENKRFKNIHKNHVAALNKQLSRRYGWSNIEFRSDHKKNKDLQPSKSYTNTKLKLAKLQRKISRQRENWNHIVSLDIVRDASFVGVESLDVKEMYQIKERSGMKKSDVRFGLSDAAMSNVLSNIKYKSNWFGIKLNAINKWTPSSKRCFECGYIKKDLTINDREWICPKCGTYHDRDINAAKNILLFASQ